MNAFGSTLKTRVSSWMDPGSLCEMTTAYSSIEYRIGLSAVFTIASSASPRRIFFNGGKMRTLTLLMSSGAAGIVCSAAPITFGLKRRFTPVPSGSCSRACCESH